jgi:acetoacetyl-CoA synthetase
LASRSPEAYSAAGPDRADLPRTKSNELVELAVRDVIHGREAEHLEALANPELLELFRDLPTLHN